MTGIDKILIRKRGMSAYSFFIFFSCFLFCFHPGRSQDNSSKSDISRISPGINYHLQISHFDFAPVIYYKIREKIYTGGGINYLYHFRNSQRKGKSSFGVNVFTRVFLHPNIFTHAEYLYADVAYLNQLVYEYYRVRKGDFFLGGGYRQPITEKTDAYLMILVNPNRTNESPYKNLILFKAGLSF
jgi:hypothetical protein